jgi:isopentenyl-diphosphate delta-isomerase
MYGQMCCDDILSGMKNLNEEYVVLVDEDDVEIGTMLKSEVHTASTPLHRAFSVFLFKDGQLLLQQRSGKKVTWPLMWSNSVCGHPLPGESRIDAVHRRAKFELGLELKEVTEAAPYQYRFERQGVVENEICPIFVGEVESEPVINPDEVESVSWIAWDAFLEEIKTNPERYSEWCVEEALILEDMGLAQS